MIRRTLAFQAHLVPDTSLSRISRLLLYVTVAALPLYTVRWHYGAVPTTLLETLVVLTILTYVVARVRQGMWRPVRTAYDIPILVLLVAGAVSVLVASDHRGALGLYRAYFLEPVALFYVAVDVLHQRSHLQRLVIAFAIGSSAFALLDLYVFYHALIANAVHVGAAPSALYGDANYVAMYMEPPFALGVALLLLGEGWRWKALGAGWIVLTGGALAVSFSKGSYLALTVLALVVMVTVPRWRWIVGIAVAATLVVATQVPLLMARLATVASSLNGRQLIFGQTLDIIRSHPIFGVGLGGYSVLFRGATPEIYPHDVWLTFWVETGVAGVLAFAVIFLGLLWRGWRAWPASAGFERVALWGALSGLVLWLVHGLVDSPYWKNDFSVEFWVMAAIIVVVLRRLAVERVPQEARASK